MASFLSAILWPASTYHVQHAGIPIEPAAIAVYVLLLIAGWAVWQGNRGSATPRDDASQPSEEVEDVESPSKRSKPPRSDRRTKNKAKRRRQGRIDWIQ